MCIFVCSSSYLVFVRIHCRECTLMYICANDVNFTSHTHTHTHTERNTHLVSLCPHRPLLRAQRTYTCARTLSLTHTHIHAYLVILCLRKLLHSTQREYLHSQIHTHTHSLSLSLALSLSLSLSLSCTHIHAHISDLTSSPSVFVYSSSVLKDVPFLSIFQRVFFFLVMKICAPDSICCVVSFLTFFWVCESTCIRWPKRLLEHVCK